MYLNLLLFFFVLALSLSCTTRSQTTSDDTPQTVKTVTRASAAKMIASSKTFKDCNTCNLPVAVGFINKRGWYPPRAYNDNSPLVKVPPTPELIKPNGVWFWLYTEGYLTVKGYELVSSEKGNGVMRPIGNDWFAPIATLQLSEVTGIKEVAFPGVKGIKVAEFTFHYVLTPFGREFFKVGSFSEPRTVTTPGGSVPVTSIVRFDPDKTYQGTAEFELYDDGWRLSEVHLNQPLSPF